MEISWYNALVGEEVMSRLMLRFLEVGFLGAILFVVALFFLALAIVEPLR